MVYHTYLTTRILSRGRKIRCDGAKPSCHNCTRRTGNGSDPLQPCTYDPAPKRRGPDKNPGSRQRLSAQEISEGGKVRRRRKRDGAPTVRSSSMTAAPSSPGDLSDPATLSPSIMTQFRAPTALTSRAEALTRGVPDGTSPSLGKTEAYHAAQQSGVAQIAVIDPNAPGQIPSLESLSHPSNTLQRIVTVNEPHFPQVRVPRTVPYFTAVPV